MKIKVERETLLLKLVVTKGGFASTTGARKLIKNRNVTVNGNVQSIPATLIKKGDEVEIFFSKKGSIRKNNQKFPFEELYHEADIRAFVKPAGIPIHTKDKKLDSVLKILRRWLDNNTEQQEIYVINKIDKRESGVLISTTDIRIKKYFDQHPEEIKERFYVVTDGYPRYKEDKLTHRLKRNKIGLLYESKDKSGTDLAILNYTIMNAVKDYALLKIVPETKIKNQIRAQMAINKTPIIGDKKYKALTNPLKRLGIHLFSLEFVHPNTREKVVIKTRVPREFIRLAKGRKG